MRMNRISYQQEERQALADERRLDVITEKLAQRRDDLANQYELDGGRS
jgi:hypothetical protein